MKSWPFCVLTFNLIILLAAVAASAPRKSLGSSVANTAASSSSPQASTPGQTPTLLFKVHKPDAEFVPSTQQRTSMPEGILCAFDPPPPGRRASGTSSGVQEQSRRKRTGSPTKRRRMTTKRLEAAVYPRPARSTWVLGLSFTGWGSAPLPHLLQQLCRWLCGHSHF